MNCAANHQGLTGLMQIHITEAAFASYVTAGSRDVLQKVCLDDARMLGLKLEMIEM